MNVCSETPSLRRILLVSRPSTLRFHLESVLQRGGWVVHRAADRGEALACLREGPFDGVVIDLMLPGAEAIGSMIAIRAANSDLPVLAVSAGAAEGAGHWLPLARSLGASTCVADPLDGDTLLDGLRGWLPGGLRQVAC
jgi:chemosensory pili system protein ChpA (sensor histidine kinase/response regulator)